MTKTNIVDRKSEDKKEDKESNTDDKTKDEKLDCNDTIILIESDVSLDTKPGL